ncbi:heavy-metal-associated domain-containing protein [Flagellimonas myxillae]|uniref:heavy-metal-associated domain-containing protein n=1 Tax=Flagellimonas myxillae TaxID=2942214 RepID=UPI00201F4816|nr:heavy-metal-associated domain-containing protein [Muricauda myxillae]MCL6267702.1 heavy-metal-associated domain-containing protein [Muricauda myxillae]
MKNKILILTMLLISTLGLAQDKNKKMVMDVNGKCDMCKMRIEKAALAVPGVKFADWSIPTHQLTLVMDERKTDAMKIKTALVEAGHDTKELKASQEAYDKIHPCCKYREDNSDDSGHHDNH